MTNIDWSLRLARETDIANLETLIELSVRELQADYYSAAQMQGALGSVFGVDRQLIRDQTYFVIDQEGTLIGCGGWSKRASLFGTDGLHDAGDSLLDPKRDAARIRAFFIHPGHARRGLARVILAACEDAIRSAQFRSIELVATLPGVPFYRALGYESGEPYDVRLKNGLSLPVLPMFKNLP